jgi:hypothetical protein
MSLELETVIKAILAILLLALVIYIAFPLIWRAIQPVLKLG